MPRRRGRVSNFLQTGPGAIPVLKVRFSMVRHKLFLSLAVVFMGSVLVAQQAATLPANTKIMVRTDQQITADTNNVGQRFTGTISQDVADSTGNVVIPKGSTGDGGKLRPRTFRNHHI